MGKGVSLVSYPQRPNYLQYTEWAGMGVAVLPDKQSVTMDLPLGLSELHLSNVENNTSITGQV